MQRVTRRAAIVVATALTCGAAGLPAVAGAGVSAYDVTNLADAGPGSLRQALLDVSDDGIDDVVIIDPALADGTITLTSGELLHSGDGEALTVQGADVTVDAAGASRVFRNDATGLLTIEDLSITGGHLDETDAEEIAETERVRGAGLRSAGDVVLRHVQVTDNVISGEAVRIRLAEGAGVGVDGTVELEASSITQNRILGLVAEAAGAGTWSLSVNGDGAIISDNHIDPDDAFVALGGGAYAQSFSLVESMVTDNFVRADVYAGGGGALASEQGALDMSAVARNSAESAGFAGGGGLAVEDLKVTESTMTGNTVRSTHEDGLRTSGGAALFVGIEVVDSEFVDNVAEGRLAMGGALGTDYFTANENGLPRTIVGSTFRGNIAESNSEDDYAFGGALAADGFTIQQSLFVENEARSALGAFGGALSTARDGDLPLLPTEVEDSTFVGNVAASATTSAGGAISIESAGVSVLRSTFSDNVATAGSAVGALTIDHSPGSIAVASSALTGSSPVCGSEVTVGAHVVTTDGSCAGASVVGDLGLEPLADNGGPTETMLPSFASALVDAIPMSDAGCAGVDQRGIDRPVGLGCDVGAIETTGPMQVVADWDARLAAGDFDGDGFDDLLAHRPGGATDGVAWNGPPRAFGPIGVGGDYESLVGDFDGDGVSDVFWYASGSRPDHVWWGDGDRTFTSKPVGVGGVYDPLVGDFDGDGASDVFWYAFGGRPDYVWWGDGDRSFTSRRTTVNGIYQPVVGDFDGDDASDIVWYAPGSAKDYIWWSDGDGTFSSVVARIDGTYDTAAGDFDGDGADDVVFDAGPNRPDYVWWGSDRRAISSVPRSLPGTHVVVPGDFDGDGHEDLYLHGPGLAPDGFEQGASRERFLSPR